MGQRDPRNLVLIGFSMSGKSTVGPLVAQRLGWDFVDTDEEIVRGAGRSIAQIFEEEGEEHFRARERQALARACAGTRRVIASGGGAVLVEENRELMRRSSVVVRLEATPETTHRRLLEAARANRPVVRPLLAGPDPLGRITLLKEHRLPYYTIADWTVHTDHLSLAEVAREVVRGFTLIRRALLGNEPQAATAFGVQEPACWVRTAQQDYPVYIGWGALEHLGTHLRAAGLQGRAYLISDQRVYALYGPQVESVLQEAGFAVASYAFPGGEAAKTLDTAAGLYDWLVERRVERRHTIVALGGGVVGDLAGYVAATALRGLPLVQVPTSLLAMVDASIGGKVGVNHPKGKNLIGALYQPRLVLADTALLETLPAREYTEGWAEVVKHALIWDGELFELMEGNVERLKRPEDPLTTQVIARSAAIKAHIVSQDEQEEDLPGEETGSPRRPGLRTLLNYGHTLGHALEAATGYGVLLHGEAVSIGMMAAARLSQELGLIPPALVERQGRVLAALGLPLHPPPGVDEAALRAALALDKKVRAGTQRWVLLTDLGRAEVRADVPAATVQRVLREMGALEPQTSRSPQPERTKPATSTP